MGSVPAVATDNTKNSQCTYNQSPEDGIRAISQNVVYIRYTLDMYSSHYSVQHDESGIASNFYGIICVKLSKYNCLRFSLCFLWEISFRTIAVYFQI